MQSSSVANDIASATMKWKEPRGSRSERTSEIARNCMLHRRSLWIATRRPWRRENTIFYQFGNNASVFSVVDTRRTGTRCEWKLKTSRRRQFCTMCLENSVMPANCVLFCTLIMFALYLLFLSNFLFLPFLAYVMAFKTSNLSWYLDIFDNIFNRNRENSIRLFINFHRQSHKCKIHILVHVIVMKLVENIVHKIWKKITVACVHIYMYICK